MKLKKSRKLENGKITLTLSVSNFSILEMRAIKALGEPTFNFHKYYEISDTKVDVSMPITKFVNQTFVFKGDVENIYEVATEVQYFQTDIFEELVEVIAQTVGEYERLANMKNDEDEEIEVGPKEEYPDDKPKPPSEPEDDPNKDEDEGNKDNDDNKGCCDGCEDDCGCGIKIYDSVPENPAENTLFGIILDEDDDADDEIN